MRRYGSVLMGKGLAGFKSVMKSFMVLIVTALAMGETLAMAPDLLKGNQMVASVFELLDRRTRIIGDTGEELKNVEGNIELRDVAFSYPSRPDVSIFKDFDLKVHSGKSVALVGQSGSGKSTVLSLILRFYDPTAGKVMIDGEFLLLLLLFCGVNYHQVSSRLALTLIVCLALLYNLLVLVFSIGLISIFIKFLQAQISRNSS